MDKGTNRVTTFEQAATAAPQPKRIPAPAPRDHGRPLAYQGDHSPVTDKGQQAQETTAEAEPTAPAAPTTEARTPAPEATETAEQARARRQQEWRMAEKSRQLQAEANEKLKKAQSYDQALQNFDKDPLALAKALNIPVDELVRKLYAAVNGMPTEKKLSAEEEARVKALQYEQKLQDLEKRHQEFESQVKIDNFLNSKLIPVLAGNPEKFEILNALKAENGVGMIYQQLNHVYNNASDEVKQHMDTDEGILESLEELENSLYQTQLQTFEKNKQLKKFQSIFGAQQAANDTKTVAKPTAETPKADDLGSILSPRGKAQPSQPAHLGDTAPDNTVSRKGSAMTREARLARMRQERGD